jgi:uncharacterized protein YqgC (DUF456 family)
MELALTIFAGILLGIGFLGTFVPILPGAPLAWAGLLLAYFSDYNEISLTILIITAIVAIVVSIVDNIFPITMTKKTGGSKAATTGSTIGLIIGLFVGPLGIILGPFCGALVGELLENNGEFKPALKVAWGAFLGFLLGTGIKMAAVVWFILVYILSF